MASHREQPIDSEGGSSDLGHDATMKKHHAHVSDAENVYTNYQGNTTTAIAICGVGLRLPGGIGNTDDFWNHLVDGRDLEGLEEDGTTESRGYFLDDDFSKFDNSMTSSNNDESNSASSTTTPLERKLLEIVRECLEDACDISYNNRSEANVACYIDSVNEDSQSMAKRISHEYDLRGPR